jgi:septum formation protein
MTALVLASGSQTRARMLRDAGVAFETAPARIDEEAVKAGLLAEGAGAADIAETLAEMKALRGSARAPGALVLGADQTLGCEGRLFDKPESLAAARAQLQALRGRTHTLFSAAVIAQDGAPIWRSVDRASLTMRPFSDAFLDEYLAACGDAALSSVGCYHLEGLGAQLFSRVQGDFFTVLGLPLLAVLGFLRARGALSE